MTARHSAHIAQLMECMRLTITRDSMNERRRRRYLPAACHHLLRFTRLYVTTEDDKARVRQDVTNAKLTDAYRASKRPKLKIRLVLNRVSILKCIHNWTYLQRRQQQQHSLPSSNRHRRSNNFSKGTPDLIFVGATRIRIHVRNRAISK